MVDLYKEYSELIFNLFPNPLVYSIMTWMCSFPFANKMYLFSLKKLKEDDFVLVYFSDFYKDTLEAMALARF